jgi:hypothetical protein
MTDGAQRTAPGAGVRIRSSARAELRVRHGKLHTYAQGGIAIDRSSNQESKTHAVAEPRENE